MSDTITPELEAVARAICREQLRVANAPHDEKAINSYWSVYLAEARAALLAIREPTGGMRLARSEADANASHTSDDMHRAVIDHILGATP